MKSEKINGNNHAYIPDSPQCIGVSDNDLAKVTHESIIYGSDKNSPILVSANELYWYNKDVIKTLSDSGKVYVYTHLGSSEDAARVIRDAVGVNGHTVLINTDNSTFDRSEDVISSLTDAFEDLDIQEIPEVFQNQYIGVVHFEGSSDFKVSPGFIDIFNRMPSLWPETPDEDCALLLSSRDCSEEIDRLWGVYKSRFEEVSKVSITEAAFDEETFKRILVDPSIIKPVHVQDGRIVNLLLFQTDLSDASWLQREYYESVYSEAYETNNILLFLGAVSDPNARGSNHIFSPINLLTKIGVIKGSDVLITFECNEVSAHYLPGLVEASISQTGRASIDGLGEPVSQSTFIKISKKT